MEVGCCAVLPRERRKTERTYQGGSSDGGKVVSVAVVNSAAACGRSLGLLQLWLVRVIVDVVLGLNKMTGEIADYRHDSCTENPK